MNRYMYARQQEKNYLAHHGVKGQKWGIRRYQNPDGTLTEEGKKRYGYGNKKVISGHRMGQVKKRYEDYTKMVIQDNPDLKYNRNDLNSTIYENYINDYGKEYGKDLYIQDRAAKEWLDGNTKASRKGVWAGGIGSSISTAKYQKSDEAQKLLSTYQEYGRLVTDEEENYENSKKEKWKKDRVSRSIDDIF